MARVPRRKQKMDNLTKGLLIAFAVVGIILAYFGGKFVFNMVKGWSMTDLPGAPVNASSNPGNNTAEEVPSNPLQTGDGPSAAAWDGKSRVNILLLGLDASSDREVTEPGPRFSDTMILVTVDPLTKTIGALSIRRDLWVNVPGYDYNKINKAYWLGDAYNLPGGGAGLAMKTTEEFLGVPIHFYAQVDFDTFVTLIDEIKGVKLDIKERILIDPMGDDEPLYLEPGIQVLPGSYALAYARVRKTDGDDVARGSRQMEVITAIRDRILDFNMLPTLISRAPALYAQVSKGVKTNMSLDQAIRLATLMAQVPRENLKTYNIDYTMVTQEWSDDGTQEILRPIPDQIRLLRDKVFSTENSGAAPVVLETGDPLTLAKTEAARVALLNGTASAGLAESTTAYFTSQGLNIASSGTAGDTYLYTEIYVHNATPYTLAYLSNILRVPTTRIYNKFDPNSQVDITVNLGSDWANNNPMP